ncbi:MAG: DUF1217 domain-containing protein [Gemmobacter sp.]
MTFQPIVPVGGYGGWAFLKRTMDRQLAVHAAQPALRRDADYFRGRIAQIESAEQLVADRRLLRVALGAFGLEADIDNRFFIRKVLDDGTLDPKALANRLADKRYQALSAAFGFGDFAVPRSRIGGFAERIVAAWESRQFEAAVGTVDENLRLALNARRDLAEIGGKTMSEPARWFTVMAQPPLRKVFEVAYGLPPAFAALDVDRQRVILEDKSRAAFGSRGVSQFTDPERMEQLLRRFLIRAEAAQGPATTAPASAALHLLRQQVPPLPRPG